MTQYILTTPGLLKETALFLSSMLDEAYYPAAHAVSCSCVDEPNDLWAVAAYYDGKPNSSDFTGLLIDSGLSTTDIFIAPVEQRNWVEESLKGLAPVRAGRFYVHGAHDRHTVPKTAICLEIDAGTAFGTGHHGTTEGCLLGLDFLANFNIIANVLDVGCGTGVLALAAAHSLKKPVIASDIDIEAVRVTKNNARTNQLGPFVTTLPAHGVEHRAIRSKAPFDLIFANILAGPLVDLAPKIAPLVSGRGHVILSGLTTDQERWVLAAWRAQAMVLVKTIRINNWSTLILRPLSGSKKNKTRHNVPVKARTGQYFIAKWLGRRFSSA